MAIFLDAVLRSASELVSSMTPVSMVVARNAHSSATKRSPIKTQAATDNVAPTYNLYLEDTIEKMTNYGGLSKIDWDLSKQV